MKLNLRIRELDNAYIISCDEIETSHPDWEAVMKHFENVFSTRIGKTQEAYKAATLELQAMHIRDKMKTDEKQKTKTP